MQIFVLVPFTCTGFKVLLLRCVTCRSASCKGPYHNVHSQTAPHIVDQIKSVTCNQSTSNYNTQSSLHVSSFLSFVTQFLQHQLQVTKPLRMLIYYFWFVGGSLHLPSSQMGFPLQPKINLRALAIISTLYLNTQHKFWFWQSHFNFQWKPGCLATYHRRWIFVLH